MSEYVVRVGYEPDADGDYRADIECDGQHLKVMFLRDRAALIEKVTRWVAAHRTSDPTNVETITL